MLNYTTRIENSRRDNLKTPPTINSTRGNPSLPDTKRNALFVLYRHELAFDHQNKTNWRATASILNKLEQYLNGGPPTQELARSFLLQHSTRRPSTRRFYSRVTKEFMNWYEGLPDSAFVSPDARDDHSISREIIEHLLETVQRKKTHKSCVERDSLLIELTLETGITRRELANLRITDIVDNSLVIQSVKSYERRIIPLSIPMAKRLRLYSMNKSADARLFGLKPQCISGKINRFARRANLKSFHLGALRHAFAVDLLERGTPIATVQNLLGHKFIASTKAHSFVLK
jgi:integrase